MTEYDPWSVEEKWQRRWTEAGSFEADPDPEREPYFVNFPYPYMNGYLHIGHTFTLLQLEIAARYHRLLGYNVLWPFAFHCTGTPIVAAAKRVADGEESQMRILREMGVPEEHIDKMADPVYWTEYFPVVTREFLNQLGVAVDWRRSFITTELNPYYDSFVRWQFTRLHEKGLVVKGKHPVIWCPLDNSPVGDHARVSGEGETPQEYTLLKFRLEGSDDIIVAATLRPETVYGQTNLWVDPDVEYRRAQVDDEIWIASKEAFEKLNYQKHDIETRGFVMGEEMLGKMAIAPGIGRAIPILPSGFCDPAVGTGIVTSVPSDAPDDWMGLVDLKADPAEVERWGLDPDMIESIEPIAIIETEGMGTLPAVDICQEMEIEDQYDRKKLQRAKEEVYKHGFYAGTMLDTIPKYGGMKVEEAKDRVKEDLIEAGEATIMYEPSGEVVCRCLTPSVVKVVTDQWFIAYGDPDWKAQVHSALDEMDIYPSAVRKQFDYVIDWLQDWACTREFGLGTKLPWEEQWVIESLSDSTVYMAFYTVNKYLQHEGMVDPERIDPDFFAYCFEGKGDVAELATRYGCEPGRLEEARAEFDYWYPFDVRGSGKDLVQNHLTFSLFNHAALFPRDKWPRGFAVNGWLRVEGNKMSKSLGNFIPLKNVLADYGADVSRFTLALGGEGVDDPNWDSETARTTSRRFAAWLDFIEAHKGTGREERLAIDDWFEAALNRTLTTVREHFDNWRFRSAMKVGYFDLQAQLRWYARRCGDQPNRDLMDRAMRLQTQILAPVAPHLAEEAWAALGAEGMVCDSTLPGPVEADEQAKRAIAGEQLLVSTMDDIREILRITGIEPKVVRLYTAPAWKRTIHEAAVDMHSQGELDMGPLMKGAMSDPAVRANSKAVPPFAQQLVKDVPRTSPDVLERIASLPDEGEFLVENKDFIEREVGCPLEVVSADAPDLEDPGNKARQAVPGRVAIYVE
jgi:leucyl-tRNA synthetase